MASGGQHYQIPGSNGNRGAPIHSGFVEIKSKFDAEFRRFTLNRDKYRTFESFRELLEVLHLLKGSPSDNIPPTPFHISYVDPKDNDLLPINNTDNYLRALQTAKPVLRLVVQRHGELQETYYTGRRVPSGAGTSLLTSMLGTSTPGGKSNKPLISISQPSEFRQVAAIIDPDQVPDTCRRVRLLKHGSDKPLGFYIRDGTSVRVTPTGIEKVPGIFISRLLAGGLAESTGLLAVNDEVLEVNGIDIVGKSLDQVTDMMVANSSNLIVTVKTANQNSLHPTRGTFSRNSDMSPNERSADIFANHQIEQDGQDKDEIRGLTNINQGLVKLERENQELSRQKCDLEVRNEQHQTSANKATEERIQLFETIEQLSSKVSVTCRTVLSLEEREQELADKLQLAYKDLDSAKNEMSVEVEQRKAAEEERLQMQEKMKHLEEAADQITVMKLQANNLTKLNAELEFKFDSLNVQNTSCLKEMAELEDKLKTKCDEFTELKEAVSKLKDVEIKLARMEAENCCTKLDLARQIEEISWLSDSLNEKQNTIAEYKNKIQHLENMNSSYVKKIADQQKELETKCDEIKDLNEAVSRINDVEMKLRNTNAEKCRKKHDLVKKTEEIASIRKTLNEKENVIEKCETKIKHLERSYRALGVPYVGNPSTPGAEKPPNDKRLMIETPLQFDVSSSTPTRRPSSASPNLMRKRV